MMNIVHAGHKYLLELHMSKLSQTVKSVLTYFMTWKGPQVGDGVVTSIREITQKLDLTRNQAIYAIKVLKSHELILVQSQRGKTGMIVTINPKEFGLDMKGLDEGAKTLNSIRQELMKKSPQFFTQTQATETSAKLGAGVKSGAEGVGKPKHSLPPSTPALHNPTIQQVARSAAAVPLKSSNVASQNAFGYVPTSPTIVQATPKVAPPAMASGEFLPTPKPIFRAMLSQERLKELCVKPPASFAALFDEVEPDWRVNTKPHYMRQIEAVDEAFRPKQVSEWAMWQMLKPTTNRPASYLPKLFEWDDPKGPYPGKNTLKNVADDDPTGAKKARRDVEKMQRSLATDKDEPTPEQRVNIQKQLREASLAVSGG